MLDDLKVDVSVDNLYLESGLRKTWEEDVNRVGLLQKMLEENQEYQV